MPRFEGTTPVVIPADAGAIDDASHYWTGSEFDPYPEPRPGPWAVWDGSAWFDPRPADAQQADALRRDRARRDRMLAESDWTQLPDAPLSDDQRVAWRDYRQALRDAPATGLWPDKPE